MIVGLLGSSCSGKSFFLKLLRDAGFYVPISVTTRPQREEEMWHLRNVEKREFEKLNAGNNLCFVTKAFGNSYACMEFSKEAVGGDVAIIITKGNIPELRKNDGMVVRILPSDPQMAMEKIQLLKRGDMDRRRTDLLADLAESGDDLADRVFYNGYDTESYRRVTLAWRKKCDKIPQSQYRLFCFAYRCPIVCRLGQRLFKPLRGVRLPLGLRLYPLLLEVMETLAM